MARWSRPRQVDAGARPWLERIRVRHHFEQHPEFHQAMNAVMASGGDPDVILCDWLAGRDLRTLTHADLADALAVLRSYAPADLSVVPFLRRPE